MMMYIWQILTKVKQFCGVFCCQATPCPELIQLRNSSNATINTKLCQCLSISFLLGARRDYLHPARVGIHHNIPLRYCTHIKGFILD